MPKALKTDWGALRALYAAGATVKEISQNTGINENTIYRRSQRGNWKMDKAKVLYPDETTKAHSSSVPKASEKALPVVQMMANQFALNKQKFLESGANVSTVGMKMLSDQIELIKNDTQLSATEKLANISKIAGDLMKTATPVFGLKDSTPIQVGMQVQILSE